MKRCLLIVLLTWLSLFCSGQVGETPVGRFHYQYQNEGQEQIQRSHSELDTVEASEQKTVTREHVSHIRFKQLEDSIVVTYDLNRRSEVSLFVSLDDGKTYSDTMNVSGSVNCVVSKGKNHTICWHAFSDLGYADYPEIWLKFVAEKEHFPRTSFVTLNGACTTTYYPSVGFTYGQVKNYGWFVSVMSGFHFAGLAPDAISPWGGMVEVTSPYHHSVMPFYKDESASTVFSVIGGGVWRLNQWMLLKAGVGYGNRSLSWKTLDDRWIRLERYSAVGVDISAGMMFKFGHVVLSFDAVTTNFSIFEGRIGLGYSFENNKKTDK